MATNNIFNFVSLRPPKYQAPEPDPEFFHLILSGINFPSPNTPSGSNPPLPVPLIVDPREERQFIANIPTSASTSTERREALLAYAETFVNSDQFFVANTEWSRLRAAENVLRQVIANASDKLPLGPDVQWVQQTEAIVARVLTDAESLSTWINSQTAQALKSSLWQSYYAIHLRTEEHAKDKRKMLFWLRLLTVIEFTFASDALGKHVIFNQLDVGMPSAFSSRAPLASDPTDPGNPDAEDAARREKIIQLKDQITKLEASIDEIEVVDSLRPTTVVVPNKSPANAQQTAPVGRMPGSIEFSRFRLKSDSLSAETTDLLCAAAISYIDQPPEEVVDAIEDKLGALESELDKLQTRTIIATRNGVFVKRTITLE